METLIWRVNVEDEAYGAQSEVFLLKGKNAAQVEKLALEKAKERDKDLIRGDRRHRPFIRSIELIGGLDN